MHLAENKNKVAIVAVGYNRLDPMKRLLDSLNNATYPNNDVPLVISIDFGQNQELNTYVENFHWKHGTKYVILHKTKLGLREHIFSCGNLTKYFKGIILLEDDIYVSTYFYKFTLQTISYYQHDNRIACLALYAKQRNELCEIPFEPLKHKYDYYATQTVITWGQCWTETMWNGFMDWLKLNSTPKWDVLDIPERIKQRQRAWSNYFYAYIVETNKYIISPYDSFTTNFNEAGEHNLHASSIAQVPLAMRYKNLIPGPLEELTKYDSYMNPMELGKFLDIDDRELNVDLHGNRFNSSNKRYVLTTNALNYKVIKTFGLKMRPIEMNIILNIEGTGIWLYDTTQTHTKHSDKKNTPTIEYLLYLLNGFNNHFLFRAVKYSILCKLKRTFSLAKK